MGGWDGLVKGGLRILSLGSEDMVKCEDACIEETRAQAEAAGLNPRTTSFILTLWRLWSSVNDANMRLEARNPNLTRLKDLIELLHDATLNERSIGQGKGDELLGLVDGLIANGEAEVRNAESLAGRIHNICRRTSRLEELFEKEVMTPDEDIGYEVVEDFLGLGDATEFGASLVSNAFRSWTDRFHESRDKVVELRGLLLRVDRDLVSRAGLKRSAEDADAEENPKRPKTDLF